MAVTKTELTTRLEPAKRQFHQWFYREFDSIRQIKDYPRLYAASPTTTSKLSKWSRSPSFDINLLIGMTYSEEQWKNRQRQWNKEWDIKKNERGLHLPTPADVVGYPLWQTESGDVGDLRSAAHKDSDG